MADFLGSPVCHWWNRLSYQAAVGTSEYVDFELYAESVPLFVQYEPPWAGPRVHRPGWADQNLISLAARRIYPQSWGLEPAAYLNMDYAVRNCEGLKEEKIKEKRVGVNRENPFIPYHDERGAIMTWIFLIRYKNKTADIYHGSVHNGPQVRRDWTYPWHYNFVWSLRQLRSI